MLELDSKAVLTVKCDNMRVILLHLPHTRAAASALHIVETYFVLSLFSVLCSLCVSAVARELNKYLTWLEGCIGFCLSQIASLEYP